MHARDVLMSLGHTRRSSRHGTPSEPNGNVLSPVTGASSVRSNSEPVTG